MKHHIYIYAALLVLAIVLVLGSVHLPQTAYSKVDLFQVKCGLPLRYLIQDMSWRDPPYPWRMSCGFYALDDVSYILWPKFWLDVFIVFGTVVLVKDGIRLIPRSLRTP